MIVYPNDFKIYGRIVYLVSFPNSKSFNYIGQSSKILTYCVAALCLPSIMYIGTHRLIFSPFLLAKFDLCCYFIFAGFYTFIQSDFFDNVHGLFSWKKRVQTVLFRNILFYVNLQLFVLFLFLIICVTHSFLFVCLRNVLVLISVIGHAFR